MSSGDHVHDLLLRAALLRGQPALDAWEESRELASDAERLDRASFRVLPQLYRNLLALGVDEPVMGKLKGIYRHAWYCNQRLFHEVGELIEQLHAAGIETMVLKGAPLATLYYRDLGARPMDDLDVLVRSADVIRAERLMREAGWVGLDHKKAGRRTQVPFEVVVRRTHSTEFADPRGREIDLHWTPMYEPVPEDAFWDNPVPLTVGGVEARAPDATNQLIHVCVHGLGRSSAPVRWIADTVMILRSSPDAIDWDRFLRQAEEWHLSARLERALGIVTGMFEVDLPPYVLPRLASAQRSFSERLAERAVQDGGPLDPYAVHWDRYRRLRRLDSPMAADGLSAYMRDAFRLPSRRALVGFGARQVQLYARGRSPSARHSPEATAPAAK